MISFALIAVLVVGLCVIYMKGALRYGNVFSIKNFDAKAKSVLVESLRINFTNQMEFKHASMLGGKDWTLYVCLEPSKVDWERILESASFTTRKGRETEIPLEIPGIPWWKIEKKKIDSILCATEGYTGMIVINENELRRVFIYTDGGPAGFPQSVWALFKRQQ